MPCTQMERIRSRRQKPMVEEINFASVSDVASATPRDVRKTLAPKVPACDGPDSAANLCPPCVHPSRGMHQARYMVTAASRDKTPEPRICPGMRVAFTASEETDTYERARSPLN